MKSINLAVVSTITFALLVSVFAFRPEPISANAEASGSSTPPRRRVLPIQSPRTIQSPKPIQSPVGIKAPKQRKKNRTQGKRQHLPCSRKAKGCN